MIFDEEKLKKTITITLTQTCNLNCIYCYENHKSKAYMPAGLACAIIDKEMAKVPPKREVEIDLFGGEPFVKFDSIKAIVEYVEKNYSNRPVWIFVTTNGTLLNDESKAFCKAHKNLLKVGLSYDGTPAMQDYNRSNSSKLIDLDFFATTYPEQTVKMTISQKTLETLADGLMFLHSKGFQVSCNLAYGIDWSNPKNRGVLERELSKLIQYYLDHPEIKPCSMLDDPISPIAYAEKTALITCGAGCHMVSYDVDGQAYPCQFFMPLSVGREKAKKAQHLVFHNEAIPDDELDPKCVNCILKSVCHRCYGCNYMMSGNMYLQDDNMCQLTKIIFRARAYFKSKLLELGRYSDCNDAERKMLMKSILLIEENISL